MEIVFATLSCLLADHFLLHTFSIYDIVSTVLGFYIALHQQTLKQQTQVLLAYIVDSES